MGTLVVPADCFTAGRTLVVHSDTRPPTERLGWVRSGKTWRGRYRSRCGCSWRGEITSAWFGWEVFIYAPPRQLTQSHPDRTCFSPREGDKWFIHIHAQPAQADINDMVHFVERLLSEAIGDQMKCKGATQW